MTRLALDAFGWTWIGAGVASGAVLGVFFRREAFLGGYDAWRRRGITVNGCFILGLDGQTPAVFDRVAEFAERTSLFDVQITVLTPFPGTPLYSRLEREGRLLAPGAWERCTLFDVNFVPTGMKVRELEEGFLSLAGRLYHPDAVRARREGYFRMAARSARTMA